MGEKISYILHDQVTHQRQTFLLCRRVSHQTRYEQYKGQKVTLVKGTLIFKYLYVQLHVLP